MQHLSNQEQAPKKTPDTISPAQHSSLSQVVDSSWTEWPEVISDQVTDAIAIIGQDGYLIFCNPNWSAMHGYNHDEVKDLHISSFIRDETVSAASTLPACFSDNHYSGNVVHLRKDGETFSFPIDITHVYIADPSTQLHLVVAPTPPASSKSAPDQDGDLEYIIDNTWDIIFQVNLDGKYVFTNRAGGQMTGYSVEELLSMNMQDVISPKDNRRIMDRLKRRIAELPLEQPFEFDIIHKDGHLVPVELITTGVYRNKKLIAVQGIARDITRRKQVEEALKKAKDELEERVLERTRELTEAYDRLKSEMAERIVIQADLQRSQKHYRMLFEESPTCLWEENLTHTKLIFDRLRKQGIADFRTYFEQHPEVVYECIRSVVITDVNKATLDLYDVKDKSHFQNGLEQFAPEETFSVFREIFTLLAEGKTSFEVESFAYPTENDRRNIDLKLSVTPGAEKTLSSVLVSAVDTTARRKLEQVLVEVSDREKERIGEDLHDVLAQELTGISLLAEASSSKLQETSDALSQELKRISDLATASMKNVRHIAHGLFPEEIRNHNLAAALNSFCRQQSDLYGITCLFTGQTEIHIDNADQVMNLYRIAQEAVNNSIKHSNASTITINLESTASELILKIYDNGNGIPGDNHLKKGMGLRIMQHRAALIGASLDIMRTSQWGGACTTCHLPCPVTARA